MKKYILALDQGTTSSRAIAYDYNANAIFSENLEFEQFFPNDAWVEHDPEDIWRSQFTVLKKIISKLENGVEAIQSIGITNQRETTVLWNKSTGKPIYNAIVWQDRRTANYCNNLRKKGVEKLIQKKTGLVLDAYFSASKINWILDHVEGTRALAEKGELAFGTIDAWLVWNLSRGQAHVTDVSNASRTMLFNIHTLEWDEELLSLFDIPTSILPKVVESSGELAMIDPKLFGKAIPINGIAGDQQAALFGQLCLKKGMMKCTYGTGCFMMLNTGDKAFESYSKMLTTIAWKRMGKVQYALEGSVFIGGAVIQWLRDELEFFKEASDSESLAEASEDNGGVYFVPALSGLGAPHWDPNARGSIFGITRATSKAHLTRAALESICFQVNDVLNALIADFPSGVEAFRIDGGAAENNLLLQFQSDISNFKVTRTAHLETTALGVAFLAGLGSGFWQEEDLLSFPSKRDDFQPEMKTDKRQLLIKKWNKAVERSKAWES